MSKRCHPACCLMASPTGTPPLQLLRPVQAQQLRRPFTSARQPARPHARRHARLTCRAAADGWWRTGEQHWTFVESEQQLQQVVDDAPNLVLVGDQILLATSSSADATLEPR